MRAAIYVRLSRETDETTSPERQRAACEALCEARGWEVVAAEEDIDVSGFLTGAVAAAEVGPGGGGDGGGLVGGGVAGAGGFGLSGTPGTANVAECAEGGGAGAGLGDARSCPAWAFHRTAPV
ncbi:recombinase family protein [Streptomyces sp. NPDC002132]|uniref:recombinase family protein n=1 Tax=unclassified Streptomyces TaxID=2593676 RepID=UPI00331F6C0D